MATIYCLSVASVAWEIRIQPMCVCDTPWCVSQRRLIMGYKLSYMYHRLTAFMVFLHAVRRMSLDSWALGCPGSGNILFQRRMSSLFLKKQWHPLGEIQSYSHSRKPDLLVTHSSPFSTTLSILLFFFRPTPVKPHCQGRVMGFVGGGGNIAIATALPPSFVYCIV